MLLSLIFALHASAAELPATFTKKNEKKSSLAVCAKGPYRYITVLDLEGDVVNDGEAPEKIRKLVIEDSPGTPMAVRKKKASDYEDGESYQWSGDLNADLLTDVMTSTACGGSSGFCNFQIYLSCGQGRYKSIVGDEFAGLDLHVDKTAKNGWRRLQLGSRTTDRNRGCDSELGDFGYMETYDFDGSRYSMSKSEKARARSYVEKEWKRIDKACAAEKRRQ